MEQQYERYLSYRRSERRPNEESRICSEHFHGGWHSDEPSDENYRPTLFSYKEKTPERVSEVYTVFIWFFSWEHASLAQSVEPWFFTTKDGGFDSWSEHSTAGIIQDNDEKTRFYTGQPTFTVFLWLFNFLKPKAEKMRYWVGQKTSSFADRQRPSTGYLELVDQLFAVVMRLRDLPFYANHDFNVITYGRALLDQS
ncbi:uncharacterized protein [Argopecten irradians]|uniref:uncharacterized protein n=1 Tax=Argopecten irradians TaxID=31199 RepID=UPI003720DE91